MNVSWWSWRDRIAVVAALIVPCATCLVLVPFRHGLPNTDAALVLVVGVVAVAANGHRIAGLIASLSAAVWFDFLLTSPYQRFTIIDQADIETTVLLLLVGAAVSELAVRGRRDRLLALTDERYLDAIQSVHALVEGKAAPGDITSYVAGHVTDLLGLRRCRFETNRFGGLPQLTSDGRVDLGDTYWDVDQYGMPDHDIELLASIRGRVYGRLLMEPTPGVIPPLPARRCAVVLVGQLAAALAAYRQPA